VADRELSALAQQWRKEAGLLRERYGLDSLARLCEVHARELTEAVGRHEAELLTLSVAAEYSGYSTSHLRALIADGTLSNVGRKGSPRLLRGELPRKAREAEPERREKAMHRGRFDAAAAAASVLNRTATGGRR
jgi:hypothetical protein